MEKKLFETKMAPKKLRRKLTVVAIISFIAGIVMCFLLEPQYESSSETLTKGIIAAVFFLIALILWRIKRNLNQVEVRIYEKHMEGTHCGILYKKEFNFTYDKINEVQYFLNTLSSGIRIVTLTTKYDFFIDGEKEACNIIRNLVNENKEQ